MAVATYSISVGTTQESSSKSLITDVLSLLPDNTSKEITPRDVRDAIFSAWESSVIRYTSDGATDYIGIDRNTVKDVKIFLGKKEISGTTVLSGLLGSDTDIFLYNTKSDSALTQNFKMSLLAGSNTGLFSTAPYISSTFVSGAPNYLSLELVNPGTYGTINIESGSSASISINNLIFPSTSYVDDIVNLVATPQASDGSTLLLATRAGGNVELLTPAALAGGTIGATGSPTNIYGTPVTVNGQPLEYTNAIPTVTETGGVAIGTTFTDVPIVDVLTAILYPYVPPAATITITTSLGSNRTLERNHTSSTSIAYTYTLTKATYNISGTNLVVTRNGTIVVTTPLSTLSGSGLVTNTYTTTQTLLATYQSAVPNGPCIMTFSVVPTDGTSSATASTRIEFVYPYFYGFSATNVTTGFDFNGISTSLSKKIDIGVSQSVAMNGTGYMYFAYPSYYGTLTEIRDGNGYNEYQDFLTWTYSYYTNIQGTNWSNGQYYVYKKWVGVSTVNPTQTYKFNF